MAEARKTDELLDPEPFSAFLVALGAAGSVASLVSLAPVVSGWASDRAERRASLQNAVVKLEGALREMRGYLNSLKIMFLAAGGGSQADQRRVAFGSARLVLPESSFREWYKTEQEVTSAALRVQKSIQGIFKVYGTSRMKLPDRIATRLGEHVGELNELVASMQQLPLQKLFEGLENIIGNISDSLRDLKDEVE